MSKILKISEWAATRVPQFNILDTDGKGYIRVVERIYDRINFYYGDKIVELTDNSLEDGFAIIYFETDLVHVWGEKQTVPLIKKRFEINSIFHWDKN